MQNRLICLAIVLLCLCCTTPTIGGEARAIEIRRSANQKTAHILDSPQTKDLLHIINFNFRHVSEQYGWQVQIFAKVLSEQPIEAAELRFIMFDPFGEDPKAFNTMSVSIPQLATKRPQTMSRNTQGLWEFTVPREHTVYGMGFVYVGRVKLQDGRVIAVNQEACVDAVLTFMSEH